MAAFLPFPCLRCGLDGVLLGLILRFPLRMTIPCHYCEAEHFLAAWWVEDHWEFNYCRYTMRYPLDEYDPHQEIFEIRAGVSENSDEGERDTFSGPIMVYPRKKRFSKAEILEIWRASSRKCHICKKLWALDERGRTGWHIDHLIPHIGGGAETEKLVNLRVACAKCNLKKGRGYTEKRIKLAISRLAVVLDSSNLSDD